MGNVCQCIEKKNYNIYHNIVITSRGCNPASISIPKLILHLQKNKNFPLASESNSSLPSDTTTALCLDPCNYTKWAALDEFWMN